MGSHTEANAGLIALVLASKDSASQATGGRETLPRIVPSLASVSGTANVAVILDETDISPPIAVYISNPDVRWCKVPARRDDHTDVLELIGEVSPISSCSHLLEKGSLSLGLVTGSLTVGGLVPLLRETVIFVSDPMHQKSAGASRIMVSTAPLQRIALRNRGSHQVHHYPREPDKSS